jgi:hypothetical protein
MTLNFTKNQLDVFLKRWSENVGRCSAVSIRPNVIEVILNYGARDKQETDKQFVFHLEGNF